MTDEVQKIGREERFTAGTKSTLIAQYNYSYSVQAYSRLMKVLEGTRSSLHFSFGGNSTYRIYLNKSMNILQNRSFLAIYPIVPSHMGVSILQVWCQ
jgi:hypothetical protein